MADFEQAFQKVLKNEGGFVLHHVQNDKGQLTYAGIARAFWPSWDGWSIIDAGGEPPADMVRAFFRANFWDNIRGDQLAHQAIAESIFDFHVNTGRPARVLAQLVAGVTPDGSFGPATLQALNAYDPEKFVMAYALAKIARYRDIVTRDRTQMKFLLGWINRTLKDAT